MAKDDYFAGGAIAGTIKSPEAVTTTGNTAPIDITDFRGMCIALANIVNTAGTNPTMAVKLQSAPDVDVVSSIGYAGTGNGSLTECAGGAGAVAETVTITFSNATTAGVVGSVSGSLGTATVGTKFTHVNISFLLAAGSTPFINTDAFTVVLAARVFTDVSQAVFTTVTGALAASHQKKTFDVDGMGRYMRARMTIGGTDAPAFNVGIMLYGLQS